MQQLEIHEPTTAQAKPFERWMRMPNKPGERIQGFSRAGIYRLIDAGKIRTAVIRQPGCTKGIRLIWEASLVAVIEKHVVCEGAA